MEAAALPILFERAEAAATATMAPSPPARVGAFAVREDEATRIVEPTWGERERERTCALARCEKGGVAS